MGGGGGESCVMGQGYTHGILDSWVLGPSRNWDFDFVDHVHPMYN